MEGYQTTVSTKTN